MVAISLQIEGQMGLTWPRWKRLVAEIEALGFAGLYRSDHFTNPFPPDEDSLELIVALTYLAGQTQRVRFGPLVAPQMITPSEFREHSARLDVLLAEVGRPLDSVRRTLFCPLHFGQTMEGLDQVLSWRHEEPELADKSLDEVIEVLRTPAWWNRLVGTPEMLVEQIRAYADAGVEELILLWFDQDNIEALRGFAESVLPRV